jgi:hypothetical protein
LVNQLLLKYYYIFAKNYRIIPFSIKCYIFLTKDIPFIKEERDVSFITYIPFQTTNNTILIQLVASSCDEKPLFVTDIDEEIEAKSHGKRQLGVNINLC